MIIYKITNKLNNKVYIGQTTKPLNIRASQHKANFNLGLKFKLYDAMREFGFDNFEFSVIEEVHNQEELYNREKYYIELYNSINDGYNSVPGGKFNPMDYDEVYNKHNEIMRSEKVRKSIGETMSEYRKTHTFSDETRQKLSESGRKFRESPEYAKSREKQRQTMQYLNVPVYCIDINGNLVNEFANKKFAAAWWQNNGYETAAALKNITRFIHKSCIEDKYIRGLKWFYGTPNKESEVQR